MTDDTLTFVLTLGYGCTALLGFVGYLPQFWAYWRNPRTCVDAPLAMWGLWALQYVLALAYAVGVNGDWMFIAITAGSLLVCVAGMALVWHGRRRWALQSPVVG